MATIEQNATYWGGAYDWSEQGDEWSKDWGGPEAQWFGAIFPRIHAFLPADTILEIAPGFGRWTQFLKDYCKRLIIVDLTERCIEACKTRFSGCSHIEYHTNDGRSLDFIPAESIDFAFSFDSLVHVEVDVIEGYLSQLARKFKSNGVGFIHHSNLASHLDPSTKELPPRFQNTGWRATSVSAKVFEECTEALQLQCVSQETINWCGANITDAFSLFTPKQSIWSRPNRLLENSEFMREAEYISSLAHLYSVRNLQDRSVPVALSKTYV